MPPLIVENFPAGLKQRLRVLAAQQNTTMREIVITACERACDQREAYVQQEAAHREPGVIPIRRVGLGPTGYDPPL
jgi:plasmid stability protein